MAGRLEAGAAQVPAIVARLSGHHNGRAAADTVVAAAGGVVWRRGDGGRVEVVLVHRPRYDDWSLPKGKLDTGEDFPTAAVREVEEETGLRCGLDGVLPSSRYLDNRGRTKLVRFWLMHPEAEVPEPVGLATGEVDEVAWLPVDDAIAAATHERDADLVRAASSLLDGRA